MRRQCPANAKERGGGGRKGDRGDAKNRVLQVGFVMCTTPVLCTHRDTSLGGRASVRTRLRYAVSGVSVFRSASSPSLAFRAPGLRVQTHGPHPARWPHLSSLTPLRFPCTPAPTPLPALVPCFCFHRRLRVPLSLSLSCPLPHSLRSLLQNSPSPLSASLASPIYPVLAHSPSRLQ